MLSENTIARERWFVIAKINTVSTLAQIVQIGTVSPLLAISLQHKGTSPATIGFVVSASWVAILLFYKLIPRLLHKFGVVKTNLCSVLITSLGLWGITLTDNLILIFTLNFILGIGLILRWIACDTWIVQVSSKHELGRAIGIHETLMGLGIALGPLIIAIFGAKSAVPFYVCIAIMLLAGALSLSLKKYDFFPSRPQEKKQVKLFPLIPVALCGAFIAGFAETSSISFLAGYAVSMGYVISMAALLVSVFGFGGTLLQLPIGFLADKSSYKVGQLVCGGFLLLATLTLPFVLSTVWLSTALVFLWGGAIGGMNTLAVIEAGNKVEEAHLSTAMSAIAMFYTLGSIIGPVVTGLAVSYLSPSGLLLCTGVVGGGGVFLLALKRE